MRYSTAILPFFILSTLVIILVLYFANITRKTEKENYEISNQINFIKDQININEIEFNIYNSYEYLSQIQKLYFEPINNYNFDNRISFNNLENNDLDNFFVAGIR